MSDIDYDSLALEKRELEEEVERLRGENLQLRRVWAHNNAHLDIAISALAEIKATCDGESDQPIPDILDGCLAEIESLGLRPTPPCDISDELRRQRDEANRRAGEMQQIIDDLRSQIRNKER